MSSARSLADRFSARAVTLFLSCVIMSSVIGYFVGIGSGSPGLPRQAESSLTNPVIQGKSQLGGPAAEVLPATSYAEMRRRQSGPTARWTASLATIPQPVHDPLIVIRPSEDVKRKSLQERAALRAFNGAPPIIPHAVAQTTDAACLACHGTGLRIEPHVARRMSHGFLSNCTQCHAPPPPTPFESFSAAVENDFVGATAPQAGNRAYAGAPPVIPHATWMRGECLACHGSKTGWSGMETTHPWRAACQQCHASSAVLEQGVWLSEFELLPH